MTPLVTVLNVKPSATILAGTGVSAIAPAGNPGRKVICVLPPALPCTETALIFAVPDTVPDWTTKLITPLPVATWIPGEPASASAVVIVPLSVDTVINVPSDTVLP